MNRVCVVCGTAVGENISFCPVCGGERFVYSGGESTEYISNAQGYGTGTQGAYYPPQQPKKGNRLMWIFIVAGVLIAAVVTTVVLMTAKGDSKEDKKASGGEETESSAPNTESNVDSNTTSALAPQGSDKIVYTKGGIENGAYLNSWAGLKLDMTGWTEANEYTYGLFENATTDCGLVVYSENVDQLVVGFEDLRIYGGAYDEVKYMAALVSSLTSAISAQGVEYTENQGEFISLGGERYFAKLITIPSNGANQYICTRILDDRAIFITASSQSMEEINRAIEGFKPID